MKWRAMLEPNGELTDANRTCSGRWSGTRPASAVAIVISGANTSATGYSRQPCGACDFCLGELERAADPVVLARKILSCVVRVGQRFGAMHVANVLRGQATEQVVTRGHDSSARSACCLTLRWPKSAATSSSCAASVSCGRPTIAYPVLELTAAGMELLKDETRAIPSWLWRVSGRR